MSGWAGLAAGTNMYIQIKQEDKKNALLERLEKQKEDRAQAIKMADEERAEARANKRVQTTNVVQVDGKYVTQYKNANGDVVKTEDADADTIEKLNNAKLKDKLTLDSLQSQSALNQKQLASYDADHSLESDFKRSQIGENNRHYDPAFDGAASKTYKPESYSSPDSRSLESAFGGTQDDKGNTHVNPTEVAGFSKWRMKHPDIVNGHQALDAYITERDGRKEYKGKLVSGGVPAPLVDDVSDSIEGGGTYKVPKSNEHMTPQVQESRDKGLVMYQRAKAAVAKGLISKAEAQAQLRQQGFPQLAKVLK